jgi:hypothetical protein
MWSKTMVLPSCLRGWRLSWMKFALKSKADDAWLSVGDGCNRLELRSIQ